MSSQTQTASPVEIEDILRALPEVMQSLQGTYAGLAERAERVELELQATNIQLEAKVRELDKLQRHLQAVLESLPCGVLERDGDGSIVQANRAAREILGLGDETNPSIELNGDRADLAHFEFERTDGNRRHLTSRRSEVSDAGGTVLGEVEIIDDQTERVGLEERLRSTDKMAALGTMAGGIAHEIRNPLNAIKGFATLLVSRNSLEGKELRFAENIVTAASRTNTIIESILSFGDPERLLTEVIRPDELLGHVAQVMRDEFTGVEVNASFDATAPLFRGDDMKLRHALRNLVANAIQVQERNTQITVNLFLDQDEIVAQVDDAGPGISADLRKRMLDPFFTTRADGTGMGMTLVDTIARLHGGHVHIHSAPSPLGGARIDLRIPYLTPDGLTAEQATQKQ